jgi:hypothetical protein
MSNSIEKFHEDLEQSVLLVASGEGNEQTLASAFTDHMFEVLTDAGEVENPQRAAYEARGARASGFEISEDGSTLRLFLTDYSQSEDIRALGKTDLAKHLKRMAEFVTQSSDGLWTRLEESSLAWEMAQQIYESWSEIGELRFTVLTNAELRTDVPSVPKIAGRRVHTAVWDIDRLFKLDSSGRAQEQIEINVEKVWGEPLPCLGPHGERDSYESYLLALPGDLLAEIYELYGPRLLELNVRSFLQARGKINKGIQETIANEPSRFFAYNNGVSMTAAKVKIVELADGRSAISRISDLQIVNGGQTTASLHYARVKSKADLSNLVVQAKLSVVVRDKRDDLVAQISQFANSQNRVNMADFTANDPFHVELERVSRTVWAPPQGEKNHMTRWFYERARGQYADAHARERTPAKQREFKKIHPLNQKFTKTDLAKFENTWDQLPWLVAFGAERNFREFMLRLDKRGRFNPTPEYFEKLVAKAILFRSAERLIGKQALGGYRSQTVTYTLAKLINVTGQRIDLQPIWRTQLLPDAVSDAIEDLAPRVHATLLRAAGTRNISEFAKKEECWKAVLDIDWVPEAALADCLIADTGPRPKRNESIAEILTDEEEAAKNRVEAVAAETWFELSKWAKQTENLQGWERSLAFSLGRNALAGKPPSRKQANQGVRILDAAQKLGFRPSAVI